MEIHEPMTLATDYALGTLSVVLAVRMACRGRRASRRWWAAALACSGLAAFAGGTYHGFLPWMTESLSAGLWRFSMVAVGVASFSAQLATARQHLPRPGQIVIGAFGVAKFGIYLAWVMADARFIGTIVDYALALAFVLAIHLWAWCRHADGSALAVVAGVLVSFSAAAIQAAGLAPHEAFNHNDLFHVVQMAGTWLLYRGALRSGEDVNPYSAHPWFS